ncbi:18151_t:CDS:2 [Gigaspora margarita]|uniref:18151_t:CDS:1 n=1 Tax=Gigaspora margarita TaxID=4874 RepID=A0ABN7VTV8_GIGMA|nr:18151_t:CDS:2 [Gigaspora margarita]
MATTNTLIKTRYENSDHEFSDDGTVIKITDINAAIIHRAREEFSNLQNQKTTLEAKNAELEKTIEKGLGLLTLKDSKIEEKTGEINRLNAQIREDREEYKVEKERREELRNENVDLKVESGIKSQEIKKQKDRVKDLEEKLIASEEKVLSSELEVEEERLENLAKSLNVERKKTRELCKLYRQLIRTREDDYNQNTIDEINDKIENIKDELLENGISIGDIQKLRRECKEFIQLKMKYEKLLRQQYQAQTELVLIHHPDKGGDAEKFREIDEAYKSLVGHHSSLPIISNMDDLEKTCGSFVKEVAEIGGELDALGNLRTSEADNIRLKTMAIQLIETRFSLLNKSPQDLHPETWNYLDEVAKYKISSNFDKPKKINGKKDGSSSNRTNSPQNENSDNKDNTDSSNQTPPNSNDNSQGNQDYDNSQQNNSNSKDKERDKKVSQLETEIEQLKNQKSGTQTPQQQAENQKKIEEKEKELEEIKKDKENSQTDDDNENYEN